MIPSPPPIVKELLSARAVRSRCQEIFDHVARGQSSHFILQLDRMPELAQRVAQITRENYPALEIPYHSRWGHLSSDKILPPQDVASQNQNRDHFTALARAVIHHEPKEQLRRLIDFVTVSVLLDAGAGTAWKYRHLRTEAQAPSPSKSTPTSPIEVGRSEGLALASCDGFLTGLFSADASDPTRVDGARLQQIAARDLEDLFQVTDTNPLAGLAGRATLMNRLGNILCQSYAASARPSALFEELIVSSSPEIRASDLLERVLTGLSALWPGRLTLSGWNLGDTWTHSAVIRSDETSGLVPFHKLSQWLTYSLLEPFEWCAFRVVGLDDLTGLAEYRNGGLFVDSGIVQARSREDLSRTWRASDEFVVEWRALTVALLDQLRPLVAQALEIPPERFPLAKMLHGGTWAAGRILALQERSGGGPPLTIESDGTIF